MTWVVKPSSKRQCTWEHEVMLLPLYEESKMQVSVRRKHLRNRARYFAGIRQSRVPLDKCPKVIGDIHMRPISWLDTNFHAYLISCFWRYKTFNFSQIPFDSRDHRQFCVWKVPFEPLESAPVLFESLCKVRLAERPLVLRLVSPDYCERTSLQRKRRPFLRYNFHLNGNFSKM